MQVNHDKSCSSPRAAAARRREWQNREMLWSGILDKLSRPTRTRETVAEHAAMGKAERDDVGTSAVRGRLSQKRQAQQRQRGQPLHESAWTRTTPTPPSWTIWT